MIWFIRKIKPINQLLYANNLFNIISDKFIQYCSSCHITSTPSENDLGQSTLPQCKASCLNEPSCTSFDYGKNNKQGICVLNYGGSTKKHDHNNYDGYILRDFIGENEFIYMTFSD